MPSSNTNSSTGRGNANPNQSEPTTYEATRALQSTQAQPDKIHWDREHAFRDYPYRQLHHQGGTIGIVRCRLLEASNLKRSYWSALALGPVKHLGLSKAHGAVSAYCTVSLQFTDDKEDHMSSLNCNASHMKPSPKVPPTVPDMKFTSPVVPQNNSPVWDHCHWEFILKKGAMPRDGMLVQLQVRVEEDRTMVEHLLPSPSAQGRLLGIGTLDVTDLCLGETPTGQILPGVRDAWIELNLPVPSADPGLRSASFHSSSSSSSLNESMITPSMISSSSPAPSQTNTTTPNADSSTSTGKVRILVSYTPYGLEPQPKDIVALEAFARRSLAQSLSRPLVPPLYPMRVLERRGPYLLVEYSTTAPPSSSTAQSSGKKLKACMRLHRNAVFVIERTNAWDTAHQLARLPVDVFEATPVGQATLQVSQPLVAATTELCKPALLTAHLLWMAVRTTGVASWTGFYVLFKTLWSEGTQSLLKQSASSLASAASNFRNQARNSGSSQQTHL
jgi:hypothetical protein